jgi:hypothetical protein
VDSTDQRLTVRSSKVSTYEGVVIDERTNVLNRLIDRESISTSSPHRDFFVQIILQFLMRHNIAKRISDRRIGRDPTLHFGIIGNRRTLSFNRSQTKTSDLNILLIGTL